MLVLGLTGGPDLDHEDPLTFPYLDGYWHDAAAVLVADGQVVAGYEQERLNRLKNTAKFPVDAVRACLDAGGVSLGDLDAVAVYFTDDYWERFLRERRLYDPAFAPAAPRQLLSGLLEYAGGDLVEPGRIHFVRHHLAHAASAWYCTDFPSSLVLTLDGAGDYEAGVLWLAGPDGLAEQRSVPVADSLGGLYLWVTRYLGYRQFDEYKVMGLAPYGDPKALGPRLGMIDLLPGGRHRVNWSFVDRLAELMPPRRAGDEFGQVHADLAAAVQDALEEAVLHLLRDARRRTGATRLCLAGGVAHNCSLNAAIAATGHFEDIFVQPASHDAGCALGAALAVTHDAAQPDTRPARRRITHTYWGTAVDAAAAQAAAQRWSDHIRVQRPTDIAEVAARALHGGAVVAWVRGRAEFGPRALGNRSLLADARPAGNRGRINAALKKRESFRPFAPVVRAEDGDTFFELPPGGDASFMSFTVKVRPPWSERLAAVTHVDGTARVQTVSREQNPDLHRLLGRFAAHGGPPVLLNTSLNVSTEPIVDSADDALVFLLTTGVDALALDDLWITRPAQVDVLALAPSLAPDARLVYRPASPSATGGWELHRGGPRRYRWAVSGAAASCLQRADGRTPLTRLMGGSPDPTGTGPLAEEVRRLWQQRMVRLAPPGPTFAA